MDKPLRVALLGTGTWASICVKSLREVSGMELVGCYSPLRAEREAFSKETGIPAVTSEEELFGLPGLEAVLVLTPNFLHRDQVVRAASRGLHVFVEKPMASNPDECRAMIEAARHANVVLFVGHNSRRELRFRLMKKMLEDGVLGQPLMAEICYTSEAGLLSGNQGWRYDPERTPSLALAQIGIHAIDILHSIFGPPEMVQAWISNAAMEGEAKDLCLAHLKFGNAVSAMFTNAYCIPRVRSLNILGTTGNLFSDTETVVYNQKSRSIEREPIQVEQNNTVRDEFEEFVACCRGEREPETGGSEGLAAMEVMDAMLRSAALKSPVDYVSSIRNNP
ncbi:Gfo/Idh/MocA family oxidoreductase [Ruficoccus amylovorans]|uniref:Gfo/Idh/MocA family oxidoreductase n=1 Tax=Ruficoccus amylovorans TaxID=1804625 RepID=A0A842HCU5_9BACT|nr:Gfo/Idh/MocA family oxidoreductase [Ruficoccus amylovorans]MBC2593211.1 Gfo/Idh/MocA family oxidoreductase [Ruficoccus amylovorans]